ncbi:hypothetical protein CR513_62379, partial [Mucuna pruriens]
MFDCNAVNTHMEGSLTLSKINSREKEDPTLFKSLMGSLSLPLYGISYLYSHEGNKENSLYLREYSVKNNTRRVVLIPTGVNRADTIMFPRKISSLAVDIDKLNASRRCFACLSFSVLGFCNRHARFILVDDGTSASNVVVGEYTYGKDRSMCDKADLCVVEIDLCVTEHRCSGGRYLLAFECDGRRE